MIRTNQIWMCYSWFLNIFSMPRWQFYFYVQNFIAFFERLKKPVFDALKNGYKKIKLKRTEGNNGICIFEQKNYHFGCQNSNAQPMCQRKLSQFNIFKYFFHTSMLISQQRQTTPLTEMRFSNKIIPHSLLLGRVGGFNANRHCIYEAS